MVVDKRYTPILKELSAINWNNPQEARVATVKFAEILKSSVAQITPLEAPSIATEIQRHPKELEQSINNIDTAFREFQIIMAE